MTRHQETIAALNELIEYCKDGEYGYKAAAEDIKNTGSTRILVEKGSVYHNERGH